MNAVPPSEYLSAEAAAARLGRTVREVRDLARAGAIPGALRVGAAGSPWAIPTESVEMLEALAAPMPADLATLDAETPPGPRAERGAAPDRPPRAPLAVEDTPTGAEALTRPARALVDALAAVPNARPARALTDLTWSLLALDLDPATRTQLARALDRAARIVTEGTP